MRREVEGNGGRQQAQGMAIEIRQRKQPVKREVDIYRQSRLRRGALNINVFGRLTKKEIGRRVGEEKSGDPVRNSAKEEALL